MAKAACIDEYNRKRPGLARQLYCPDCQRARCVFESSLTPLAKVAGIRWTADDEDSATGASRIEAALYVIEMMGGPAKSSDVAELLGWEQDMTTNILGKARRAGRVIRTGWNVRSRWLLAEEQPHLALATANAA